MCKCCSSGKHASKYKQFEFLQGHTHSHEGVTHDHDHEHHDHHHEHHHHSDSKNPGVVSTHVHGEEQELDKE